jgi:hypothetical protein
VVELKGRRVCCAFYARAINDSLKGAMGRVFFFSSLGYRKFHKFRQQNRKFSQNYTTKQKIPIFFVANEKTCDKENTNSRPSSNPNRVPGSFLHISSKAI